MKTIYKYIIEITRQFAVKMPEGAKVIHVDEQFGKPFMWAMIDTNRPNTLHHFWVYGTGNEIPKDAAIVHVGSVITSRGSYVWHVFFAGTSPISPATESEEKPK